MIGTKQHLLNWILSKAADLNWQPVWGKGVCSDLNRTAQLLQMAASKSLETMSGDEDWHDSELISTKVCSQIRRKWNVMFESHIVISLDRTSFNFLFEDFFKQSAFVNNHLLCYWPTIHNLILKICPKFQGHSSQWALSKTWKLCKLKIFQL